MIYCMSLDYQIHKISIQFLFCHLLKMLLFSNAHHGNPLVEGDEVSTNGAVTNQVQLQSKVFLIFLDIKCI